MKKENKQMAKERRAREKAQAKRQKLIKTILMIAGICLVAALLIVLALNQGKKDTKDAAEDTSAATETVAEDTVQNGDTVFIDYVGSIDGVEFEGGNTHGQGTELTIGSHMYIDDFEEQLIGHKAGDEVDVNVTFPEDYQMEDLAGKDALFKVTIHSIY